MTSRSSEPTREEPARGAGKERLRARHEDNRGRSLGFHAAGQPITKGSVKPYMGARGHAIPDDPRLAAWEQTMAWSAKAAMARAGLRPYDCPVRVSAEFRLPCPASPAFRVPATASDRTRAVGTWTSCCAPWATPCNRPTWSGTTAGSVITGIA